jgi:hypothetical protein
MGMYDTVIVPCPTCGTTSEFQSKGGQCLLKTYSLDEAPDDVLLDVNRHAPDTCGKCGTRFGVAIAGLPRKVRTLEARSAVWPDAGEVKA